jgi:hypothetical protein
MLKNTSARKKTDVIFFTDAPRCGDFHGLEDASLYGVEAMVGTGLETEKRAPGAGFGVPVRQGKAYVWWIATDQRPAALPVALSLLPVVGFKNRYSPGRIHQIFPDARFGVREGLG